MYGELAFGAMDNTSYYGSDTLGSNAGKTRFL